MNATAMCSIRPLRSLRPRSGSRLRRWNAPPRSRVAGAGLLLSRIAIGGGDRPSHEIQIPLVERYLAELPSGIEPRIGFSRTVYPSRNPKQALADLTVGSEEYGCHSGKSGRCATRPASRRPIASA